MTAALMTVVLCPAQDVTEIYRRDWRVTGDWGGERGIAPRACVLSRRKECAQLSVVPSGAIRPALGNPVRRSWSPCVLRVTYASTCWRLNDRNQILHRPVPVRFGVAIHGTKAIFKLFGHLTLSGDALQ